MEQTETDNRLPPVKTTFTDESVRAMRLPTTISRLIKEDARRATQLQGKKQLLIWDEVTPGLALLLGAKAKTFIVQYKLNGKWRRHTIGRYGEILNDQEKPAKISEIRVMAEQHRGLAEKGTDPRKPKPTPEQLRGRTFEEALADYVELHAKPRQRSWKETERILKANCKDWLNRPIKEITQEEAQTLIDGYVKAGHGPKADQTRAWLRSLWRFAATGGRKWVPENFMPLIELDYDKKSRERVYSADEINAIWKAASQLRSGEAAYIKLLLLLAPRKKALACLTADQLDDAANPTLWTTPNELTKSRKTVKKRVYKTPLSPLATRILKPLLRDKDGSVVQGRVWGIGVPMEPGDKLKHALIEKGAPADFTYHACRHTVSTWLENEGHDEYDGALVLNHAGAGSVTSGYRHGYALDRKRDLLQKWADHVESLIKGDDQGNVTVLR